MSVTLRFVLIIMSFLSGFLIIYGIRKAKVRIEDSVFWIFFSIVLVFLAVFPGIVVWGAKITGVSAPVNFVFLTMIFVLLIKLFRMTVRVSQLESKLQTIAQNIALNTSKNEDK